jgi:hypothetical protein
VEWKQYDGPAIEIAPAADAAVVANLGLVYFLYLTAGLSTK